MGLQILLANPNPAASAQPSLTERQNAEAERMLELIRSRTGKTQLSQLTSSPTVTVSASPTVLCVVCYVFGLHT